MSDLIDRQAAIKELTEKVFYDYMDKLEALQVLDELPSVEPRPKGAWIPKEDGKYHCSGCDGVAPKGLRWSYCPHCGVDMR